MKLLLVATLALVTAAPSAEKSVLVMAMDKEDHYLGVMVNETACTMVARWLNTWASVPPVTPVRFVCRSEADLSRGTGS